MLYTIKNIIKPSEYVIKGSWPINLVINNRISIIITSRTLTNPSPHSFLPITIHIFVRVINDEISKKLYIYWVTCHSPNCMITPSQVVSYWRWPNNRNRSNSNNFPEMKLCRCWPTCKICCNSCRGRPQGMISLKIWFLINSSFKLPSDSLS